MNKIAILSICFFPFSTISGFVGYYITGSVNSHIDMYGGIICTFLAAEYL